MSVISKVDLYFLRNEYFLTKILNDASQNVQQPSELIEKYNAEDLLKQEAIDGIRLAQDERYFLYILDRMLRRARRNFLYGWYDKSEKEYNRFFTYQHYYGRKMKGFQDLYFNALFERFWVNRITSGQKNLELSLNQELMKKLYQATLKPDDFDEKSHGIERLTALIKKYEDNGKLPKVTNPAEMSKQIPSEVLVNLLSNINTLGYHNVASHLLGHIEVRMLITMVNAERLVNQTPTKKNSVKTISPFLNNYLRGQQGVPMAPALPVDEEDLKVLHPEELPDIKHVYTDLVEPVYALKKDPNEEEKRQAREKKRIEKYLEDQK